MSIVYYEYASIAEYQTNDACEIFVKENKNNNKMHCATSFSATFFVKTGTNRQPIG